MGFFSDIYPFDKFDDLRKEFGLNPHIVAVVPGIFAYKMINNDFKDPEFQEYSKLQKGVCIAATLTMEMFLDAIRIGAAYGFYKVVERMQ